MRVLAANHGRLRRQLSEKRPEFLKVPSVGVGGQLAAMPFEEKMVDELDDQRIDEFWVLDALAQFILAPIPEKSSNVFAGIAKSPTEHLG